MPAMSGPSTPSDSCTVIHLSFPASYETEAAAMQPAVAVGLDGSPESLAAAHWAAELQARHSGLSIVGNLVADDGQNALLQAATEFPHG